LVRKSIDLVGLSGHEGSEHKKQCLSSGMDEAVTKPLKKNVLEGIIKKVQNNMEIY
jgi:CheY-like chemotaxis protein